MSRNRNSGFERQDKDFYPTPTWVTEALLLVMLVNAQQASLVFNTASSTRIGNRTVVLRDRSSSNARVTSSSTQSLATEYLTKNRQNLKEFAGCNL
jgi:hypothetical protein